MGKTAAPTNASLRWAILRRAFLASSPTPDHSSQKDTKYVSRKTACGFNLLSCHVLHGDEKEKLRASLNIEEADNLKDAYLCYELSVGRAPRLVLMGVIPSVKDLIQILRHDPIRPEEVENKSPERQRLENYVDLCDFEICNQYGVDNTGLISHSSRSFMRPWSSLSSAYLTAQQLQRHYFLLQEGAIHWTNS